MIFDIRPSRNGHVREEKSKWSLNWVSQELGRWRERGRGRRTFLDRRRRVVKAI